MINKLKPNHHFKPSKEHILIKETIIEAGKIALNWHKNNPKSWKKEDGTSVSEADLEINKFIYQNLLKKIKNIGWLSEENKDDLTRLDYKKIFLVDPIDGTKSFLEGKSDFCISIALISYGRPVSGIVFNPATKELFEAEKNKGAWVNSKRIYTSSTFNLTNSKMCAFKPMFSHPAWKKPWPTMKISNKNSIAYRMSLVAKGDYDSMMALNNKNDWDLAAGDLLINEAGGIVTDHKGKDLIYNQKNTIKKSVIGCCEGLHHKIIGMVQEINL